MMTYDLTQPGQNLVLSVPKGFGGDTECILVLSAPAGDMEPPRLIWQWNTDDS